MCKEKYFGLEYPKKAGATGSLTHTGMVSNGVTGVQSAAQGPHAAQNGYDYSPTQNHKFN